MNTQGLLRRVDELIEMGNRVLATRTGEGLDETVDSDTIKKYYTAITSLIEEIHGYSHPLFKEIETQTYKYTPRDAKEGIAVLKAMRIEIQYAGEFGH